MTQLRWPWVKCDSISDFVFCCIFRQGRYKLDPVPMWLNSWRVSAHCIINTLDNVIHLKKYNVHKDALTIWPFQGNPSHTLHHPPTLAPGLDSSIQAHISTNASSSSTYFTKNICEDNKHVLVTVTLSWNLAKPQSSADISTIATSILSLMNVAAITIKQYFRQKSSEVN